MSTESNLGIACAGPFTANFQEWVKLAQATARIVQRVKSPIHRRTLIVNGTLGVLLIGGAGYGYASLAGSGSSSQQSGSTGTVSRGTVMSSVSASGSVSSADTQAVSFSTSGTVTDIEVQ